MAATMHLNTLVSNMFAMGLLDDHFQQLQMLKDGSAPDFIARVVTLFCEDSERIIVELAKMFVGAQRMKKTCIKFHEFCQRKGKDGCLKTLDDVRNDFYDLRRKFQTIVQLEQQVQAFYAKQ